MYSFSFTICFTFLLFQAFSPLAVLGLPSNDHIARGDYGGNGKTCKPKGAPQQLVLRFDDIPTSPDSDFGQLGMPGGVPYEYNGFKFYQENQWYILRCNNFQNNPALKIYYGSCGGSTQALWTAGAVRAPESILSGPQVFDIDSFFITPVQFASTPTDVKVKVTGIKNDLIGGRAPSYETKVKSDVRTQVKGLKGKGFDSLRQFEIHVFDAAGNTLGYVIDDVQVRKWDQVDCNYH